MPVGQAIVRILIPLALAVWLGVGALAALRSGIANAAGVLHRRRSNPGWFWGVVAVQCFLSLLFIGLALDACGVPVFHAARVFFNHRA